MPSKPDSSHKDHSSQGLFGELKVLVSMVSGGEKPPETTPQTVRESWLLLLLSAAMLTAVYYISRCNANRILVHHTAWLGLDNISDQIRHLPFEDQQLVEMIWWAVFTITGYLGLPVLWSLFAGQSLLDNLGWRLGKSGRHVPIYGAMALIMALVLGWATRQPEFLGRYPFYHISSDVDLWPRFFIWEMFYLIQFIALESFFRGFLIYRLANSLGSLAVPVAMVPYCMIHFGKPAPEAFASILAGLGLGLMSLRTRSVWPGAVLHMSVALTMDIASLIHQGRWS